MINTNILNNFINVTYNYIVDDKTLKTKVVNINSNSVSINLIKDNSDIISGNASIQYRYYVNPNETEKIAITNSKTVKTLFSYASLKTSRKTSDIKCADINDTINYIITIMNNGNLPADNIIFKDPMPDGIEFVPCSIVIDGEPINDASINPNVGFNINAIAPKMFKIVTFKVKIINIPLNNEINNIAQFYYNFSLNENDSSNKIYVEDKTEKGAVTKIFHANLSTIRKEVDKNSAYFGDILTYKTTIPNTGNIDAINVCFHEYIPNKTTLVEGSIEVIVDEIITYTGLGNKSDTIININIDRIPPKKEAVVLFKVIIAS